MPDRIEQDERSGYQGAALEIMNRYQIRVWSDTKIETTRGPFRGIVLPRAENTDDTHIVIKIDTGYNIGIDIETVTNMVEMGYRKANYKIPEKEFPYDPIKKTVQLLGTGGTIASRLDYRTGAVIPAFSPGELYGSVPELADIANLQTEKLFGVFSENMGPEQYIKLAAACKEKIDAGARGIVIGHGTDTMHHTAAAMSFMLQNLPVPIVMVGSQRSSDRPSSDAAINLLNSTYTAAHSDIAEVMVCMFGPTSDQYGLLHQGTRVRKMHSSYRSTFRTIDDVPLAMVDYKKGIDWNTEMPNQAGITPIKHDYNKRDMNRNVKLDNVFDDRVSLVYYYPAMKPDIIDSLIDNGYRGIVIAGTGLGHINKPVYPAIERAKKANVAVFMTVQTLWGYAQMYVYDTGRDLMAKGIIPLGNMLPEVAYIKLGWALGHSDDLEEVKKLMLTPIANDMTEREPYNGYLVYQGGIPEIQKFLKEGWR